MSRLTRPRISAPSERVKKALDTKGRKFIASFLNSGFKMATSPSTMAPEVLRFMVQLLKTSVLQHSGPGVIPGESWPHAYFHQHEGDSMD